VTVAQLDRDLDHLSIAADVPVIMPSVPPATVGATAATPAGAAMMSKSIVEPEGVIVAPALWRPTMVGLVIGVWTTTVCTSMA
jgi:hypothetical protein